MDKPFLIFGLVVVICLIGNAHGLAFTFGDRIIEDPEIEKSFQRNDNCQVTRNDDRRRTVISFYRPRQLRQGEMVCRCVLKHYEYCESRGLATTTPTTPTTPTTATTATTAAMTTTAAPAI